MPKDGYNISMAVKHGEKCMTYHKKHYHHCIMKWCHYCRMRMTEQFPKCLKQQGSTRKTCQIKLLKDDTRGVPYWQMHMVDFDQNSVYASCNELHKLYKILLCNIHMIHTILKCIAPTSPQRRITSCRLCIYFLPTSNFTFGVYQW